MSAITPKFRTVINTNAGWVLNWANQGLQQADDGK